MQDEQRHDQQFDLLRFLSNAARFLRRTWWIVALAAALGAVLTGIYVRQTYTPQYECHAVLSVHSSNNTVTDIIGGSEKTEADITKQIIKTFPAIISSEAMRDRIMREIGNTRINGSITPQVIADSNLFTLTVRSTNPQDAYDILNAVLKCYPEMAFIFIGAARLEIIEAPVLPAEPTKKLDVVKPTILGGLIVGLVALAILCMLGQMQTTVNSSTDLQRFTNVPCIVHVPQTVLKRRSRRKNNQLSLLNSHLPPAFEESIRVLRSRLLRQIKEQDLHKIIITSTIPGEGKSTIAANLALSFSRSNLRVVLIDADLRTQELREFFGIEGEPRGLSELLQDPSLDVLSCLTPVPDTNVQLLCGARLDRPVGLLRRGRLGALLDRLDEAMDIVLIDTPPIGMLTDAAAFAQHSDAALYVVRAGATSGNRIADGLQAVADCHTKILGYVLNGVSARTGSHGYGYRYSYGYGYGSRYSSGYGGSYGSSGYHPDRGSYSHYGSYHSYGSYGSYGGYGSYENALSDSASAAQKKTEKTRKSRSASESTTSRSTRQQTEPAAQTSRSGSRRSAASETPKHAADPKPSREPVPEAPKRAAEPKPNREPVPEAPKRAADPKPDRRPAPEAPKRAADLKPAPAPAKQAAPAASYDDPELEAIVREVLETTTEDDVRRAYETLEAENAHRAAAPKADDSARRSRQSHSLFHHDKKK